MSAGGALQAALASALASEMRLTGIYDGPPARAAFPYAVIDAGSESDWSHKSGDGREVLVALTVWDDAPARLAELADAVEAIVAEVSDAAGWQLVSFRLLRRRTVRDVAGPWAAAIDFRARLLAT
ncbi:MAG: DUF3168 domain-containing protein [Sphingomonas sp.]|uniref:DUF3168 domain-containing protein n=1 Tax=Sphingomonas sp. TaxID=28214 RepID=UPI0017A16720|nr:DUF3168 domain-containing protein [Sphingomonas sp.]MBA3667759.1 DUF3168 domain-containing protein [Sphingomonas sp.]